MNLYITLAVAVLTFLAGTWSGSSLKSASADRQVAAVQKQMAEERAAAQRKYQEAVAQVESLSAAMQQRKEKAEDVRIVERTRIVRVAADLDADVVRLRDDIASYAVGLAAAEDSLAAARGRAETLGRLLDEALRLGGQSALDAEQLATDVRTLRAAWPVSEVPRVVELPDLRDPPVVASADEGPPGLHLVAQKSLGAVSALRSL